VSFNRFCSPGIAGPASAGDIPRPGRGRPRRSTRRSLPRWAARRPRGRCRHPGHPSQTRGPVLREGAGLPRLSGCGSPLRRFRPRGRGCFASGARRRRQRPSSALVLAAEADPGQHVCLQSSAPRTNVDDHAVGRCGSSASSRSDAGAASCTTGQENESRGLGRALEALPVFLRISTRTVQRS
jgi:hypothetical protein